MKYLFSPLGLKVLRSLSFGKTLYAFDFDGTLAPIVRSPENAMAANTTIRLLERLSRQSPVAVISGRSINDLKPRLGFKPAHLVGNHGLEGLSFKDNSGAKANQTCKKWIKQLEKNYEFGPDVFIENKTFSLALHYRRSRNKKEVKLSLFKLLEDLAPSPRIIMGKCVFNLIPPGAPHKGVALLELMLKFKVNSAFYIGDDDTDEDVFSLTDDGIICARIGQKRSSRAHFFLRRQSEINRLLKEILRVNEKYNEKGKF